MVFLSGKSCHNDLKSEIMENRVYSLVIIDLKGISETKCIQMDNFDFENSIFINYTGFSQNGTTSKISFI